MPAQEFMAIKYGEQLSVSNLMEAYAEYRIKEMQQVDWDELDADLDEWFYNQPKDVTGEQIFNWFKQKLTK